MTEKANYFIYVHKNKINEMKYIGMTCRNPKIRFGKEGKNYKNSPRFFNAIKKYGWNNFEHIILFGGLSKKEAEEKEKELIKSYKTTEREFGYNIAKGGNGGNNKKVSKIKKYDLKGNLIQIYENATEAALSVKGNRSCITHCCKMNKNQYKYKNFMWCYENQEITSPYKRSNSKRIFQYALNEKFLKCFDSINDAAKEVNGDVSAIARCANHQQKYAYNFLWKWSKNE